MTYKAKAQGNSTPVLVAEASGNWPNQAYAFSAVVGKGSLPKTVIAAERRVAKTVQLAVGETLNVELPGNPSTGYTWAVSPLAVDGVIEQVGDIASCPEHRSDGCPRRVHGAVQGRRRRLGAARHAVRKAPAASRWSTVSG